jgi:hypothetical protein
MDLFPRTLRRDLVSNSRTNDIPRLNLSSAQGTQKTLRWIVGPLVLGIGTAKGVLGRGTARSHSSDAY